MEWISVEDRLPKRCGMPLFLAGTNAFGQQRTFEGFTGYMEHGTLEFRSNVKDVDIAMWRVTHWMPMPDPPEEE